MHDNANAIVDEMTPEERGKFGGTGKQKAGQSQSDRLVALAFAAGVELFHQDVDEPFASVKIGRETGEEDEAGLKDHHENWPIHGKGFRRWLSREFWKRYEKVPSSQALQDALTVLSGQAIHKGKQISVHTRVAECDGKLYLDLADDEWRAIEVTSIGWEVITKDVPVKFVRSRGMLPLPEPRRGGSIDELRPFLNVRDDDPFALIKAFLVSALRPKHPFAFLVLTGEQGSGKTSLSIKLKSLIDPSKAAVRGLPRDVRDLAIAAGNSWILSFDNVSKVHDWTSDALCCLSTGGGFGTRELYTDSDEKIFDYMRPMILNGIGDIVTRPDLLDRCIILQLPVIYEQDRRQESELSQQFGLARPRMLGALLDAVVIALRNCSSVKLPNLPRMADFATWGVAAEPAHSQYPIFLEAYKRNRAHLNQVAIDSSVIGPSILELLHGNAKWGGYLSELLEALNGIVPDSIKKSKSWPSIPRTLKNELVRLAPNLRQNGINVTFAKRTNKGIPVTLEQTRKLSSSSPPLSPSSLDVKTKTLSSDDGSDDRIRTLPSSLSSSLDKPNGVNASDDSVDGDDQMPTYSGAVEELEL